MPIAFEQQKDIIRHELSAQLEQKSFLEFAQVIDEEKDAL